MNALSEWIAELVNSDKTARYVTDEVVYVAGERIQAADIVGVDLWGGWRNDGLADLGISVQLADGREIMASFEDEVSLPGHLLSVDSEGAS